MHQRQSDLGDGLPDQCFPSKNNGPKARIVLRTFLVGYQNTMERPSLTREWMLVEWQSLVPNGRFIP